MSSQIVNAAHARRSVETAHINATPYNVTQRALQDPRNARTARTAMRRRSQSDKGADKVHDAMTRMSQST
eukprot:7534031-Lingulodinium_polyedra.AAC.1